MSDTVQETREKAENAITRFGDRDASHDEWVLCVAALDAYAQSVRAEERARLLEWVGRNHHVARDDMSYFVWHDELLAALTGGPHE